MTYDEEVKALEAKYNWTLEEAADCGCNYHPDGPCEHCWGLGWAIGGIKVKATISSPENHS
jgi:hypothetical protein